MKNLSIATLVLALAFISCKKDRVCSCDVSTVGVRTIQARSASLTYSLDLNLPLPIPITIPPLEILQGRDTTITSPYNSSNQQKTTYDKVSKKMANAVCPASSEEPYNDGYTTIIPGSATITVTESGKKTYTCKIE